MKKLFILSLVLMFAFFSCSKKNSSEIKDEVKKDTKVSAEEFIKAVKDGNAASVKEMLAKDASLVKAKSTDGIDEITLNMAAFSGKKDICDLLIKAGADVNFKDAYGNTPLHNAARTNYKDVIDLLLENKADINAKNGSGESVVFYAAYFQNSDLVKYLITKGADKNIPNSSGQTPLEMAKDKKYDKVIEALK